jgi:hypothetical protein
LHHILPQKYGGKNSTLNLKALYRGCHQEVSAAVQSKDIEKIIAFEYNGILKDVSLILTAGKHV